MINSRKLCLVINETQPLQKHLSFNVIARLTFATHSHLITTLIVISHSAAHLNLADIGIIRVVTYSFNQF